jgi:hypothetical protein
LEYARKPFFSLHVYHAPSANFQAPMDILQHPQVFVLVIEIPERGEHIDHQIE